MGRPYLTMLLLLLLQSMGLYAQRYAISNNDHMSLHVGAVFSKFHFENTDKQPLQMKFQSGNSFAAGYVRNVLENHLAGIELSYFKSNTSISSGSVKSIYGLEYLGFSGNYSVKLINEKRFSLEPSVYFGLDYLLSGEQDFGAHLVDLVETNSLKPYLIKAGLGIKNYFYFQQYVDFLLEYRYSMGLNDIEGDDSALGQSTRIALHQFIAGFRFHL